MKVQNLQKVVTSLRNDVEVRIKPKEGQPEVLKTFVVANEGDFTCERCGTVVEANTMLLCGDSCSGK